MSSAITSSPYNPFMYLWKRWLDTINYRGESVGSLGLIKIGELMIELRKTGIARSKAVLYAVAMQLKVGEVRKQYLPPNINRSSQS